MRVLVVDGSSFVDERVVRDAGWGADPRRGPLPVLVLVLAPALLTFTVRLAVGVGVGMGVGLGCVRVPGGAVPSLGGIAAVAERCRKDDGSENGGRGED